MAEISKKDTQLAAKAGLYTLLTIILGYVLLGIPYIHFLAEAIILLIVMSTLFDFYGYLIFESAKEKANKKTSKKKGK